VIEWTITPNQPVLQPWLPVAPSMSVRLDGRIVAAAKVSPHRDPLVTPQVFGSVEPEVVADLMEQAG